MTQKLTEIIRAGSEKMEMFRNLQEIKFEWRMSKCLMCYGKIKSEFRQFQFDSLRSLK